MKKTNSGKNIDNGNNKGNGKKYTVKKNIEVVEKKCILKKYIYSEK